MTLLDFITLFFFFFFFLVAETSSSDKIYTAQDMGILGGILAALLLIALVFLGLMIYKQYGKTVKFLINKKVSAFFVPGPCLEVVRDLRRVSSMDGLSKYYTSV